MDIDKDDIDGKLLSHGAAAFVHLVTASRCGTKIRNNASKCRKKVSSCVMSLRKEANMGWSAGSAGCKELRHNNTVRTSGNNCSRTGSDLFVNGCNAAKNGCTSA